MFFFCVVLVIQFHCFDFLQKNFVIHGEDISRIVELQQASCIKLETFLKSSTPSSVLWIMKATIASFECSCNFSQAQSFFFSNIRDDFISCDAEMIC